MQNVQSRGARGLELKTAALKYVWDIRAMSVMPLTTIGWRLYGQMDMNVFSYIGCVRNRLLNEYLISISTYLTSAKRVYSTKSH